MGSDTESACINAYGQKLVGNQETVKTKTLMNKDEILLILDVVIEELRSGYRTDPERIALAFEAIKHYIESAGAPRLPKHKNGQKPKDWEELWAYVHNKLGMTNEDAKYLWNNWQANGFTRNGTVILDWQAAARAWKAGKFYPSQKVK